MWPLDLPARDVLKLAGETVIPWAVFDPDWYSLQYPEVAAAEPRAALEYYFTNGQRQGHSPNRLFDEQWHRLMYPLITDRMAAGHYESVFDAYCRRGALDRSAHWLFDELAYRARYPDLTNDVFAAAEICNGYDHYLRHGGDEGRIGHQLFDPTVYLSHFDPADVAAIRGNGVFQHYLERIESGAPELRTSIYFDPAWYVQRYPEVARQIEAKRWKSALHHYLCNNEPTAFDPLESFSEAWYLGRDPGLRKVIEARSFRNGYMHFLRFGAGELRSPSAPIDLVWYAALPSVRADLQNGLASDAYSHWLTIGAPAGLPSSDVDTVTERQARGLLHQTAAALLPIAGRFGHSFECVDPACISVVMVVRDGFATTMATIASLRSSTASDIELIIVDQGSDDETRAIGQYAPGAKVLRFDAEVGWARAADAGRRLATAPFLLFLSSSAQIVPGSLDRARIRLVGNPTVGAVGGMILQPHGVIAQAGGILWNDGSIDDYQRGASPLASEANFVREVDFCGPGFLLVRAALLSGFDDGCAAGYEVVDLCLQITGAGFRVIYDPSVMIVCEDPAGAVSGCLQHFRRRHQLVLADHFAPAGPVQVFARHAGARPHRVLFIEDTVPLRRLGSGFVRANDLVHVMASIGCAVTVFPVNGSAHDLAQVFHDMPDTVEVMHTLALDRLAAFLEARPFYYDTIWVARAHNLGKVRPILMRLQAEGVLPARIVLDTEALTPYREAIQAELAGQDYDRPAAMGAILADASVCQETVAVTAVEGRILERHGFPAVSVIGHMIDPKPTTRRFQQRAGMLFVGAIHTQDSPNLDGLIWFVDLVLPLIEAELKWETRLTIVGYVAPFVDLKRFKRHPRITLRGPVADLTSLYNTSRIFVAPTRYAAGAPYKVLEAASRGLPVVATNLLCEKLNWAAEQEILVARADDPAGFAASVVTLYRDEALWDSLRNAALKRLVTDNSRQTYVDAVSSVLGLTAER